MKKVLNKKVMRGITLFVLTISLTMGLINGTLMQLNASSIRVSSVRLNKTKDALLVNKTDSLKTTVSPIKATNKSVTWKSSNTRIARVDKWGRVTAVRAGRATITATTVNGGKRATCVVTVTNPVRIKSVRLNKTKNTLMVNKTDILKANISPSNTTNKLVTWKSSNTKIARVDRLGKVTTVSAGKATITATTSDGNKRSTYIVTVIKPITKAVVNAVISKPVYNGSAIKQQLYSIGFFSRGTDMFFNKYGKEGADQYDYISFGTSSGNVDMGMSIWGSNPEVDQKLKTMFGWILPTKGSTLYSILDNPNCKSQTVNLDRRNVVISVDTNSIHITFGPIK